MKGNHSSFVSSSSSLPLSAGGGRAGLLHVVEAEAPVVGLGGGRTPLQRVSMHIDDKGLHEA